VTVIGKVAATDCTRVRTPHDSREYLRQLCVGQEVVFRVDYSVPAIGREFATVYVRVPQTGRQQSVSFAVVSAGWARVRPAAPGSNDAAPELPELLRLQEVATAAGLGLWAPGEGLVRPPSVTVEASQVRQPWTCCWLTLQGQYVCMRAWKQSRWNDKYTVHWF
jgi:endonuclease YncB( thermonuclease family)